MAHRLRATLNLTHVRVADSVSLRIIRDHSEDLRLIRGERNSIRETPIPWEFRENDLTTIMSEDA